MKLNLSLLKAHKYELYALGIFLTGGLLGMLGLIQKVSLLLGILGIVILTAGMFWFCISFTSERAYKKLYKDSYEIEHETIEDEIRKSMIAHRYQEAVINRYESACRDLGMSEEQQVWLLKLLTEEQKRVDEQILAEGGGHI
ncbi:MAG: hypothetical protein IJ686_04650 [Bacteroidales bacterium]|nr:hypothetical protein [Bacteroidales bacterium]